MRGIGPDADDVRTMKRRERRASGNPKGIASSSPRLARQRLPWVNVTNRKQPNRVAANSSTPTIQSQTELGVFLAAMFIACLVPIIGFLIFQRSFLRGSGLGGAIKG